MLYKLRGEGAHCAPPPPLAKTLLLFSESIQVKFFWKLVWSKNESPDTILVSMGTIVSVLRLFISFRFLTGNPYSKSKTLFPCWKSTKLPFSESLSKTKSDDTTLVAMLIVLSNLRPLKHKKECGIKFATMTASSGISSPNSHNRLHLGYSSWKLAKTFEFCEAFVWRLPKFVVQKHASTLDVALVTKGGRMRLKTDLKNKLSKLSENLKFVAQGVLEIFDKVYLGGTLCPPPPSWLG